MAEDISNNELRALLISARDKLTPEEWQALSTTFAEQDRLIMLLQSENHTLRDKIAAMRHTVREYMATRFTSHPQKFEFAKRQGWTGPDVLDQVHAHMSERYRNMVNMFSDS